MAPYLESTNSTSLYSGVSLTMLSTGKDDLSWSLHVLSAFFSAEPFVCQLGLLAYRSYPLLYRHILEYIRYGKDDYSGRLCHQWDFFFAVYPLSLCSSIVRPQWLTSKCRQILLHPSSRDGGFAWLCLHITDYIAQTCTKRGVVYISTSPEVYIDFREQNSCCTQVSS